MEKITSAEEQVKQFRRTITILIVDDRPENLLTLESIIEKEGRNIVKAAGGNEALRIAIKEDVGLILLDIQMPDIDGLEVAQLLRSNNRTRHIPIIFVSAVTRNEKPCLTAFEEGTVDCLYKPLDLEETQSKVAVFEQIYRLRSEKNEMTAKAEKLNRNLEQFVYIISHDLKAPLRAIDNLSNWIADDLGPNAEPNTIENLSLLRSRVTRLSSLLEGVLDYSRSGKIAEAPGDIDVSQMAQATFEAMIPPDGFRLEVGALPIIRAERTRVYKVLYHLINNAIIHHHDVSNGRVKIDCISSPKNHTFSIADNGPGIKIQYSEKIFEIFSTLKSKDEKETTGVGLSIVKKVLDDIGQTIWLENSEQGSLFKFTLPV
jgi:two-component system, sensor histidine kinase and response regulator